MTAVMELISKEELTQEKLLEIYKQAFIDAHIETDKVAIVLEGFKMFAVVEPEPRFNMRLWSGFTCKPTATREQVLELCNRVNDSLVMIRACYPKVVTMPVVYLDYYIDTETGISPEEIIFETRQFAKVAMGIVPLDTDGILA